MVPPAEFVARVRSGHQGDVGPDFVDAAAGNGPHLGMVGRHRQCRIKIGAAEEDRSGFDG